MANLGYIQVVRICNHRCGFCSNPSSGQNQTLSSMMALVDDFVVRGYYGVILTGGEPTLHPGLPEVIAHARRRGLHVRLITNGHRMADPTYAEELVRAGLELVHVSVYSVRPEVEAALRGVPGSLDYAFRSIENARRVGLAANVNCVIARQNADHLDENVAFFLEHHPHVRHFVWNALDPSMGRAELNRERYTPRLRDFEASLGRAAALLAASGRTFRVEKVPLCYMTDFACASTETRKKVKAEERIVCFLDERETVRQTLWDGTYSDVCGICTLRQICAGLFSRGEGYSTDELYPVFVPVEPVVEAIRSGRPPRVPAPATAAPARAPAGGSSLPRLTVPTGPACNNRCVFCAQGRAAVLRGEPGRVPALLSEGAAGGLRRVAFAGGEPTLCEELCGWVETARSRGFSEVLVQTNGRRLAYRSFTRRLAESGATRLDISLHGPEPRIHDYHTRVDGSFHQTVKGIVRAREVLDGVGVTTVITRSNLRHLEQVAELVAGLGADAWRLRPAEPRGTAAGRASLRLLPPAGVAADWVQMAVARSEAAGVAVLYGGEEVADDRFAGLGPYQEPWEPWEP